MNDLGNGKQDLWSDAQNDDPSTVAGMAYQVILDYNSLEKETFENDPILEPAATAIENIDLYAAGFEDCSVETSFNTTSNEIHIPDYKQCQTLFKPLGSCQVTHSIEINAEDSDIVFIVDNSQSMRGAMTDLKNNVTAFANMLQQGDASRLRIGGMLIGGGRKGGPHTQAEIEEAEALGVELPLPWETMDFSYDSDVFYDWIFSLGIEPGTTYANQAAIWAINNFEWRDVQNKVIVTIGNDDGDSHGSELNQLANANDVRVFTFHNNSDIASIGTNLATHFSGPKLLKMAQMLTVVSDSWTPQDCVSAAIATTEEFCEGSFTVTPSEGTQCTVISGFEVCIGDPVYEKISEPPITGVPKLTSFVNVGPITCDYNIGQGDCWTGLDGVEYCIENTEDNTVENTCTEYEENPACGFISQNCVSGAEGSEGTCYVQEKTYDCGYTQDVGNIEVATNYDCGGEIACMGDDCITVDRTQSADFVETAALLQVAEFVSQDMSCQDSTGEDNSYCEAFAGEEAKCKIAVGGTQDCCDQPVDVSLDDYLSMLMGTSRLSTSANTLQAGAVVYSSYQLLNGDVSFDNLTQPFTSYVDSISGAVQLYTSPIGIIIDELIDDLKDKVIEYLQEMMADSATSAAGDAAGSAAADAAAEEAANAATDQAVQGAISGAGFIMAAYMYYQLAVMAIQLIYSCEEEEFMLNAKKELKQCHYVGSYCSEESSLGGVCIVTTRSFCCYNSPLSRIVQEQIANQTDGDYFGSDEYPICTGIPLDEIADINWAEIDLSEWIGLLDTTGNFPDVEAMDMDSITGSGSQLNIAESTEDTRLDTTARTVERMELIDGDEIRTETASQVPVNTGEN